MDAKTYEYMSTRTKEYEKRNKLIRGYEHLIKTCNSDTENGRYCDDIGDLSNLPPGAREIIVLYTEKHIEELKAEQEAL